jgi:hypothetical protein
MEVGIVFDHPGTDDYHLVTGGAGLGIVQRIIRLLD